MTRQHPVALFVCRSGRYQSTSPEKSIRHPRGGSRPSVLDFLSQDGLIFFSRRYFLKSPLISRPGRRGRFTRISIPDTRFLYENFFLFFTRGLPLEVCLECLLQVLNYVPNLKFLIASMFHCDFNF